MMTKKVMIDHVWKPPTDIASSGRPLSSLAAKTAGSIDWKIDITIIVAEDNNDSGNEDNHGVNDDENEDDGDDDVGMCENDYDDSDGDGNDVHLGHHLCVAVDQVVAVQGGGQLHLDDDDDDDGDDENDGYDK